MNQSFIKGFVKKAEEYGLSQDQTEKLIKSAIIGPLADIGNLGIPSLVGASIGHNYHPADKEEYQDEMKSYDKASLAKALKYLMIPGYTGYRLAKENRLKRLSKQYGEGAE